MLATEKALLLFFSIIFSSKAKPEQCLVHWASPQLHDMNALEKMVDPALRGLYPPKSLSRFADIIALCVKVSHESTMWYDWELSSIHNAAFFVHCVIHFLY